MNGYVVNRTCPCARCRARGLMGSVILITLGLLFLIHTLTPIEYEMWPVLLIVIGVMLFLGRSASTEGHLQPLRYAAPMAPPSMTPPPPAASGNQPGPEVNR